MELKTLTWGDLEKLAAERNAEILSGRARWGKWRLEIRSMLLVHEDGYDIPVDEMTTSAAVLDWIAQVAGKTLRYTAEDVGHLVRALDEILDLQASLCGMCASESGQKHGESIRPRDVFYRRTKYSMGMD